MIFSSTVFLFLFLPVTLLAYYNPIVKGRSFKNGFLLFSSLLFYGWGEPIFVVFMIGSILLTWYFGLRLQDTWSRKFLVLGIVYHVTMLFVFKYLTFFTREAVRFGLSTLSFEVALPIGISFFTFQLMSYLFDIYYKKAVAQKNPLAVGLYTALFPQLIAGPIVRYQEIALQITERTETFSKISSGVRRFVYGLGKKVLIANYMGQVADFTFETPNSRTVLMAWLGAVAYTFQIYFDFSGYSDMAIGLGKMFGFDLSENFRFPYVAKSVTEFWRRWHISLSSWFRDYVYIPLGGNRVSGKRWILNLFIVWFLTGIWHGANWTFLLWGMIYFIVLLVEKLTGFPEKIGAFSYVYTALIILFAWVVFRAENISSAVRYIKDMFGIGNVRVFDSSFVEMFRGSVAVLLFAAIGVTPIFGKCCSLLEKKGIGWMEQIWLLAVFVLSIAAVVASSYNPFIYFNF